MQINSKQKQPPEVFYKKGILRNFAKFTGNTCARVSCAYFIKKEALTQVFSCEFWEIFKNTFSAEHLRATASFMIILNLGTNFTSRLWNIIFDVLVTINLNLAKVNMLVFLLWCQFSIFQHNHSMILCRGHFSEAVVRRCS